MVPVVPESSACFNPELEQTYPSDPLKPWAAQRKPRHMHYLEVGSASCIARSATWYTFVWILYAICVVCRHNQKLCHLRCCTIQIHHFCCPLCFARLRCVLPITKSHKTYGILQFWCDVLAAYVMLCFALLSCSCYYSRTVSCDIVFRYASATLQAKLGTFEWCLLCCSQELSYAEPPHAISQPSFSLCCALLNYPLYFAPHCSPQLWLTVAYILHLDSADAPYSIWFRATWHYSCQFLSINPTLGSSWAWCLIFYCCWT